MGKNCSCGPATPQTKNTIRRKRKLRCRITYPWNVQVQRRHINPLDRERMNKVTRKVDLGTFPERAYIHMAPESDVGGNWPL